MRTQDNYSILQRQCRRQERGQDGHGHYAHHLARMMEGHILHSKPETCSRAFGVQANASRRRIDLLCKTDPPLSIIKNNVLVFDEQIAKQDSLSTSGSPRQ